MSATNEYQAGYCNIGKQEKQDRRRFGYFGTILTILGIIGILGLNLDPILALLLIIPAYMAVIGFYQDRSNFCVYFGFSGLYDMEEEQKKIRRVQDEIKRKVDRKRAIKMSFLALVYSGILTIIFFVTIFGIQTFI